MIRLKDFNAGDKAYMLAERNSELKVVTVAKVGRTYVTLENGKRFSEQSAYEFCLADNWEYGTRHYLFKTEEDYKGHCKKLETVSAFRDFTSRHRLETVPLINLEKALESLKGGVENE